MVDFKIVDGDYWRVTDELITQTSVDYYVLKKPVAEIRKKYGLNQKKWNQVREELIKRFGEREYKRGKYDGSKNYYKYDDKYAILKSVNGRTRYYGTAKTEEEAQKLVRKLEKNNWRNTK